MIETKRQIKFAMDISQAAQFEKKCKELGLNLEQGILRLIQDALREDRE